MKYRPVFDFQVDRIETAFLASPKDLCVENLQKSIGLTKIRFLLRSNYGFW